MSAHRGARWVPDCGAEHVLGFDICSFSKAMSPSRISVVKGCCGLCGTRFSILGHSTRTVRRHSISPNRTHRTDAMVEHGFLQVTRKHSSIQLESRRAFPQSQRSYFVDLKVVQMQEPTFSPTGSYAQVLEPSEIQPAATRVHTMHGS